MTKISRSIAYWSFVEHWGAGERWSDNEPWQANSVARASSHGCHTVTTRSPVTWQQTGPWHDSCDGWLVCDAASELPSLCWRLQQCCNMLWHVTIAPRNLRHTQVKGPEAQKRCMGELFYMLPPCLLPLLCHLVIWAHSLCHVIVIADPCSMLGPHSH